MNGVEHGFNEKFRFVSQNKSFGQGEIVQMIKSGHFHLDERNMKCSGRALLHEAAAKGNDELIKTLIQCGANLHCLTYLGGNTALHLAVSSNLSSTTALLLKLGANPNFKNNFGAPPFFYAKSIEVMTHFCNSQCDFLARNKAGESILQAIANVSKTDDKKFVKFVECTYKEQLRAKTSPMISNHRKNKKIAIEQQRKQQEVQEKLNQAQKRKEIMKEYLQYRFR